MSFDLNDLKKRMQGALDSLDRQFTGLRTGRASVQLLDPVMIDAYGSLMPVSQVGTVSAPDARLLSVSVWDKGLVSNVEVAIRDSGLGLNPVTDGQLIRIPLPELSEERRKELVKVAGKYAEQSRISVRNVRRDGMDSLKKLKNQSEISEDELRDSSGSVQDLTDQFVKSIDAALEKKEQEILKV